MYWNRRRVFLSVVFALSIAVLWLLLPSAWHEQYYHTATGVIRVVKGYQLQPLPNLRLRLFTVSDTVVETELSRYLGAHPRSMDIPGEFIACGYIPVTLIRFAYFKRLFEPILTEAEFRTLLELSLAPDYVADVNRLMHIDLVGQYEELVGWSARRHFLEREFPRVWSAIAQRPAITEGSAREEIKE